MTIDFTGQVLFILCRFHFERLNSPPVQEQHDATIDCSYFLDFYLLTVSIKRGETKPKRLFLLSCHFVFLLIFELIQNSVIKTALQIAEI